MLLSRRTEPCIGLHHVTGAAYDAETRQDLRHACHRGIIGGGLDKLGG